MHPDTFFMHLSSLKDPQLLIYLTVILIQSVSFKTFFRYSEEKYNRKLSNLQMTGANTHI